MNSEFSFRARQAALARFGTETFDLLVIGGGITGAAVARDAATRGLSVALVEKNDFAWGTSSRSSKLIHGGLRYLQNFEFSLVFEALAERALLLKTVPHMVRPLPFYFPVYAGDPNGRAKLGLGMWLYDLLALFRTPGFHRGLSRKRMLAEIPALRADGLKGGFRYYDASMWDDMLVIETLRSAQTMGVAAASYVEAVKPVFEGEGESAKLVGFDVRDREPVSGSAGGGPMAAVSARADMRIRARQVVVCAGPWTDQVGRTLSSAWRPWLKPSKGVHLIFDLKRLPMPGAMVMSEADDGRISFVIPRPDFGAGVVIVGTTDGPTPESPEKAAVEPADVEYLLGLLGRYFPSLKLSSADILSAYVGVRPLMGDTAAASQGDRDSAARSLQKVSREHHIDVGPGGSVVVAGGKYTTHRKMAEEIVDFAIARSGLKAGPSRTARPLNPAVNAESIDQARVVGAAPELAERYGGEATQVIALGASTQSDPAGFPYLEAQLRYAIRQGMVLHLEDFYLRRVPLHAARADHGRPWAERLAQVWAEELGRTPADAQAELLRLYAEIEARDAWRLSLGTGSSLGRKVGL
jgi:glycerol-3-phosphate dehydrogenase